MEGQNNNIQEPKKKGNGLVVALLSIIIVLIIGVGVLIMVKPTIFNFSAKSDDKEKKNTQEVVYTEEELNEVYIEEGGEETISQEAKYSSGGYTAEDYSLENVEKLLQKFGLSLYGTLPAYQGIYRIGYTDAAKLAFAIENVEESKKTEKVCSEIYLGKDNATYVTDDARAKALGAYYKPKNSDGVCDSTDKLKVINYEDVNKVYNKMYGTDAPKKSLTLMGLYYKFYDYNEDGNFYNTLKCEGCGGTAGGEPIYRIRAISYNNIEHTLTVIVAFDFLTDVEPYKVGSLEFTSEDGSLEDIKKKIINEHLGKIQNYKITFKRDGNDYIFKNLEKTTYTKYDR